MGEAVVWYLSVQAAALAAWPVVARALAPFDDRGWALSKAAGVLALAWLVWLVCMLTPVPYTRGTLLVGLVLIAAVSWGVTLRRQHDFDAVEWLRERRWLVLTLEVVFLVGVWLFALLRSRNPGIEATEKPMDMAFLNGFLAAQSLPTQDTWLAGFGVPYYYFGYFVLASVGKLSGVAPGVAYNLGAATVPALTMVGLAGLIWSLARSAHVSRAWAAAGATVGVALVVFAGNWSTFFDLLVARGVVDPRTGDTLGIKNFAQGILPGIWPPDSSFWWFRASRVIPNLEPDGINEFPFFSALLSDLHPHFVALPFEVLVLAVGAVHVISRGETLRSWWTQGLAALALGGLLVINTWDIAPFWLLYWGLSLYAALLQAEWRWRWPAAAATPFAGAIAFAPFFVGFSGPPLGLGFVVERTPLASILVLFGWAIVLLAAIGLFARWCIGDRQGWTIAGVGAVAGLALTLLGEPTLGLLLALFLLLLPGPGFARLEPAAAVTVGIAAFAAAILLGCEVIFLDDVFHSRMNTVFKFHVNAWLMAGLAAGLGLAMLSRFTVRASWIMTGLAAVALVGGLVYPLTAIATRMRERPPYGITLDGTAFLSADDRAAVRWLADQNGPGGRAVVAEAVGGQYSTGGRMATYSGAASVLGWAGHELQWRGPLPELGRREADIRAIYVDAPPDTIRSLLDRYGARFVVVGDLERSIYGESVSTRFDGVLPVAFRTGATTIYRAR